MEATHALDSVAGHLNFYELWEAKEVEVTHLMNEITRLNKLRGFAVQQGQLTGITSFHRNAIDVIPGHEPWKDVNQ